MHVGTYKKALELGLAWGARVSYGNCKWVDEAQELVKITTAQQQTAYTTLEISPTPCKGYISRDHTKAINGNTTTTVGTTVY